MRGDLTGQKLPAPSQRLVDVVRMRDLPQRFSAQFGFRVAEHLAELVVHKQPSLIEGDLGDADARLSEDGFKAFIAVAGHFNVLTPGSLCTHTDFNCKYPNQGLPINLGSLGIFYATFRCGLSAIVLPKR